MRPPCSGGFNLLEMAMVLAIIGVVVSVALPSWRSAQLQQVENQARTLRERLVLSHRSTGPSGRSDQLRAQRLAGKT